MAKKNVFIREAAILDNARDLVEAKSGDSVAVMEQFQKMCLSYEDLLEQAKLITQVSDRLQNKLNNQNEIIASKNSELQETLDELTKAKASKSAATITMIFAVVLFFIEEFFLDKVIQRISPNPFVSFGAKAFMVFIVLKPVESIVEKFLLQQSIRRNRKELVAAATKKSSL